LPIGSKKRAAIAGSSVHFIFSRFFQLFSHEAFSVPPQLQLESCPLCLSTLLHDLVNSPSLKKNILIAIPAKASPSKTIETRINLIIITDF
jgi:hypothetical protein